MKVPRISFIILALFVVSFGLKSYAASESARARAIQLYNQETPESVLSMIDKFYQDSLAVCDDCNTEEKRLNQKKAAAIFVDTVLYAKYKCIYATATSRSEEKDLQYSEEARTCAMMQFRAWQEVGALGMGFYAVNKELTTSCYLKARLPNDDADFPVRPELAEYIGNDPIQRTDFVKLMKCLRKE